MKTLKDSIPEVPEKYKQFPFEWRDGWIAAFSKYGWGKYISGPGEIQKGLRKNAFNAGRDAGTQARALVRWKILHPGEAEK